MKKRVLILIEDGSFTFDNRVIRESQALAENGWDVTVVCPKDESDPFYLKKSDHFRVFFYLKPNASSALGHLLEHSVSLTSAVIYSWIIFLRYRFRVIHACNPMDIFWIPALPLKLFGVRFIFDQHDLCPELYLSRGEGGTDSAFFRILQWLERKSFEHSDAVIATNESYKSIATDRGEKLENDVFVVRNGPNLDKFRLVAPREGLKSKDEILVGYLGNMNPQDGVDYLLRAAKVLIVDRELKHLRFVLIGGGSYHKELQQICTQMNLDRWVTFTGRVDDDEMLATLSACDVCVQPDPSNPLNDISTMNKVMEYMSLSKPVVAFDLKETRVSCGDAALYARPNDEVELADKILAVSLDEDLRTKMGVLGRKRVEERLAWQYSVPHLIAAYDRAVS